MPNAFTLHGLLQLPPDDGQPLCAVPFSSSGSFQSKVDLELNFEEPGTRVVDLGTVGAPGAKALVIGVELTRDAQPVYVRINGGSASGEWEICPGGFIAYADPRPVRGITTLVIVHTAPCCVCIRVLG